MNNNQDIKFSIVMPVYGVERFIEKSIQSIQNQIYKNFEIILVNDCTKDKSGDICKKYAENNDNIIYCEHEENKGLSETRNTGMQYATGQYILFLDSDDYFEYDLLSQIYNSLKVNMADVVLYGIIEEYMDYDEKNIKMIKEHSLPNQYYSNRDFRNIVMDLEEETLYGYAWNKAYNLKHLKENGLRFKNVKHIEDIEFNVRCFDTIKSLNIIERKLYHYVQHGGERLTNKKIDGYFDLQKQRIEMLINQQKKWNIYNDEKKEKISLVYFRSFFSALERSFSDGKTGEIKAIIKREYKSNLYDELRKFCKPKSMVARFLFFPAKHKNFCITKIYARIIHIAKSNFKTVFSRLKQVRK